MSRKSLSKKRSKQLVKRRLRKVENVITETMPLREKLLGHACRRNHSCGLAIT